MLAAGTDTVGSKALLQRQTGRLRDLGIDLVAMSVNDVVTCGAEPVLFLDCISIGRLDPERVAQLVEGVADGCRQAGCALLGGETAEMPDLYGPDDFDVAGFAVGVAERRRLVGGARVEVGDAVIGLASSGRARERLHARPPPARARRHRPGERAGRPARADGDLRERGARADASRRRPRDGARHRRRHSRQPPAGAAAGLGARLELASWPRPEVFGWLAGLGVEEDEMRRVFNIGLGFLVVVPAAEVDEALRVALAAGHAPYRVGEIVRGDGVELV